MTPTYKRDKEHNYMILEAAGNPDGSEYQIRMLLLNSMKNILSCKMRRVDGTAGFYYDITGKQPISHVFEKRLMGQRDIENLLTGLEKAMDEAKRYLLDVEQFLMEPELIYLDKESGEPYFCYLPFYEGGLGEGFRGLAEYILKRLDHSEEEAVLWGYDIYSQSLEGDFHFGKILKNVRKRGETEEKQEGSKEEPELLEEAEPETEEGGNEKGEQILQAEIIKKADKEEAYQYGTPEMKKEEGTRKEKKEKKADSGKHQKRFKKRRKEEPVLKKKNLLLRFGGLISIAAISYAARLIGELNLTQTGGILFLLGSLFIYFTSVFKPKPKEIKTKLPEFLEDLEEQEEWNAEGREEETVLLWEDTDKEVPILVSLSPEKRENVVLDKEIMIVGKKAGQADIPIELSVISRNHAKIERKEDGCYLTDLGSRNGTFLDGRRIKPNEPYKLSDGMNVAFSTALYYIKL